MQPWKGNSVVFPVAGVEIHPAIPPMIGLVIGVLSGLFGIGGGFLVTPALVWVGVPPVAAVGTCLNQMIATSSSGTLLNFRLRNVSARVGACVAGGGALAGVIGTLLVKRLLQDGAFGSSLGTAYVFILFAVGGGMVHEYRRTRRRAGDGDAAGGNVFRPSPRTYATAFGFGLGVGVMSSFLGGGGGIVLVPALIYALRVPTRMAVGTSLFSLLCVSIANTVFHASVNQSVDVVLAALLMSGSVPGACLGVWLGRKVKPVLLRGLFGGVLLLAAGKMLWDVLAGKIASSASSVSTEGTTFESVRSFALEHGVLYGMAAVAFAVTVGLTVGTLLRRRVCGELRPAPTDTGAEVDALADEIPAPTTPPRRSADA
jgi:hypothetical protein